MMIAVTILLMLAVAYAHMRDGLFTALCMCVNVILAGLMAFCFFEPFADWLERILHGGFLAGYEDFFALVLIFAGTMIVMRALTNRLAPEMLDFPANAQYGGAGVGLVTGYFLAGFLICSLETLPWHENFMEFRPRVNNDTGLRSVLPPDRVWLSMMRYAGAHCLAWQEDQREGDDTPYGRFLTFDRDASFEQRYLRYRRFGDNRGPLTYQKELDRELGRGQ